MRPNRGLFQAGSQQLGQQPFRGMSLPMIFSLKLFAGNNPLLRRLSYRERERSASAACDLLFRGVTRLLPLRLRRLFVVRLVMSPLVPASVIDVFRAARDWRRRVRNYLWLAGRDGRTRRQMGSP